MGTKSSDAGLEYLAAYEARRMLDTGEISSVDLTRAVLQQIERLEPILHSYVTVTVEKAVLQAEKADRRLRDGSQPRGPLTGVPVMIKDNISTAGVHTTAGSQMLKDYVPPYDASTVIRLRQQGAVIVGKGNMDEFAMGSSNENSAFGPTRNPWDRTRVPGGSSGGPAAGVAAGECAISLGSDTGGSIRQPAAFCGVVGMKPTYGIVSRYGLIAFASSLDQIGPLARNVRDCADTLDVIAGYDPLDSTSSTKTTGSYSAVLGSDIKGMRFGVPREYLDQGTDPGVLGAFNKAISVLEDLGAVVDEISLPLTRHALAVYYIIAPAEASANLARYDGFKYGFSDQDGPTAWDVMRDTRQRGFGDEVKRRILIGAYALSAGYYDAFYKKAQQVRTLIIQEFSEAFDNFDALVTPTSPTVAFAFGERVDDPMTMYKSDVLTIPVNIAGLPGISVPCGLSDGLPVGLQLIGPQFGDTTILKAAYAYEQATSWHTLRPNI